MSRSTVVDQRYRLQAPDLGGIPQRVIIGAISFQGLEELTPVLHFEGLPNKHLVLNSAQRQELIRLMHSSLCSDWVGRPVELRAIQVDQAAPIVLAAPTTPQVLHERMAHPRKRGRALSSSWWMALVLLLMLAALLLLERSETVFRFILQFLE
jgi:hypothetical protein